MSIVPNGAFDPPDEDEEWPPVDEVEERGETAAEYDSQLRAEFGGIDN